MSNSSAILPYLLKNFLLKLLFFVSVFLLIPKIVAAADDAIFLDNELGSCSSLNKHLANGVVDAWGNRHPSAWGFTGIHFLINGLTGELFDEQLKAGKAPWKITVKENMGLGGTAIQSCANISNVYIEFVAQTDINALEWLPKKKPPKACWDQWKKKRSFIHSHEKTHATDYKKIASDETKKLQSEIKKMQQVPVCGPTPDEAITAALQKIGKSISAGHARMVKAVQDQTARHDHQAGLLSPMDCSKCEKSYSFSSTAIGCTSSNGEHFGANYSGHVCGDPVEDTWELTQVAGPYTYQGKLYCAAPGTDREKELVEEAQQGPDFIQNFVCVYRDEPTPQITFRHFTAPTNNPYRTCVGPIERKLIVNVKVSDKCEDN